MDISHTLCCHPPPSPQPPPPQVNSKPVGNSALKFGHDNTTKGSHIRLLANAKRSLHLTFCLNEIKLYAMFLTINYPYSPCYHSRSHVKASMQSARSKQALFEGATVIVVLNVSSVETPEATALTRPQLPNNYSLH